MSLFCILPLRIAWEKVISQLPLAPVSRVCLLWSELVSTQEGCSWPVMAVRAAVPQSGQASCPQTHGSPATGLLCLPPWVRAHMQSTYLGFLFILEMNPPHTAPPAAASGQPGSCCHGWVRPPCGGDLTNLLGGHYAPRSPSPTSSQGTQALCRMVCRNEKQQAGPAGPEGSGG